MLAAAVLAVFFEPLFLGASFQPFDNRLFPPFRYHLDGTETARPMSLLATDFSGWVIPTAFAQRRALEQGGVALWDPYEVAGMPLFADQGFPLLSPSVPLFLILEPPLALTVSLVLHLLLLGAGTFLLFRRFGQELQGALLGAATLMLSGWVSTRLHLPAAVTTLSWTPWVILAAERLRVRPGIGRAAVLALTMGGSLAAGFQPLAGLSLAATALFFVAGVWRSPARRCFALGMFGAAVLLAAMLAAVQLVPGIELLRESLRSEGLSRKQFIAQSLEPESLLGFVAPHAFGPPVQEVDVRSPDLRDPADFPSVKYGLEPGLHSNFVENILWVGLIPLALAGVGLWWRRRRGDRLHAVLLCGALAVALGVPGIADLARFMPAFGYASPRRVLWLAAYACAWLAASGLSELSSRDRAGASRGLLVIGLVLVLASLTGLLPYGHWLFPECGDLELRWFHEVLRRDHWSAAIMGGTLVIGALLLRRHPRNAVWLLLIAGVLELVLFARHSNPPQSAENQYAETPVVSWLRERGVADQRRFVSFRSGEGLGGGASRLFGLRSIHGHAPLLLRPTAELLGAMEVDLIDLEFPRVVHAVQDPGSLRSPILDLLGVEFVITGPAGYQLLQSRAADLDLELVYASERELVAVYRRPAPCPPAFLVEQVQVVPDFAEALERMASPAFSPLRTALLEKLPTGLSGTGLPGGPVELRRPSPERIECNVETPEAGLLVVSESYFPGWEARLDGSPAPIHRVDHALMGLVVPAGSHRVELSYSPESFRWGSAISWSGLLCVILALVAGVRPLRWIRKDAA